MLQSLIFAAPSPTMQYLINEPLSMLDMGLYKLETYLNKGMKGHFSSSEELSTKLIRTTADLDYNYSKDMIVVHHFFTIDSQADEMSCKKIIKATKSAINLEIWTAFKHNGFIRNSEPKSLLDDVKNKIYIKAYVTGTNKKINCESYLVEETILFPK